MNEIIAPATIAPSAARYAQGVLTSGATRWLNTAGIVGAAPDGTVPDGIAAQARQVWSNLAAILADADMATTDIVSVTTYVVAGSELGPVMAARDEFMTGHLAASTLVTVPGLARPEWLVEIAIVAAA